MSYSLETTKEIWDDKTGDCLEIGPDRDSLGLLEFRFKGRDGVIEARLVIHPGMAPSIIQALSELNVGK